MSNNLRFSGTIKPPNIGSMSQSVPREVRAAFDALKGWIRQIETAGGVSTGSDLAAVSAAVDALQSSPPGGSGSVSAVITGLAASGGLNQILLQWDAVDYEGGYVEIWRAPADDIGQAVLVGTTSASLYADTPPDSSLSVTYYYWARIVKVVNDVVIEGPFNATAGTPGSTGDDPEYLLQIAAEKWQASYDYDAGDLTMPTVPNGYCYEVTVDGGSSGSTEPTWPTTIDETVSDGDLTWKCKAAFSFEQFFKIALVDGVPRLTLKDLYLADGIIKYAMMGALSVDDAHIVSMSGNKITASSITADKYNQLRNSLIFNGWDSLDASYPLEIPFLLLDELQALQSVRLSFRILPYRSYSTGAASGGGSVPTTTEVQVPTHAHQLRLVGGSYSSNGYRFEFNASTGLFYLYKSDGPTSGYVNIALTAVDSHTHYLRAYYTRTSSGVCYYWNGSNTVRSSDVAIAQTTTTDEHLHDYPLNGAIAGAGYDVYYYNGTLYTTGISTGTTKYVQYSAQSPGKHTHNVTIPNHAHNITFGIYEESNSPSITVNTNNGDGWGTPIGYTSDQYNVDLTSRFSGAGWKALRFTTTLRCRIAFVLECKMDISA